MISHQDIDKRSLLLARAVAKKIDQNPELLDSVRDWASKHDAPAYQEWQTILAGDWAEVRRMLLQETSEGQRLRQSSPFVGILTPRERWKFFPTAGL